MLTIAALASWEEAVLASIRGATGTIEEKDAQVRRSGLYAEYPTILRSYLDNIASASDGAEALKRAVFIVWLGGVEPAPFTGIAELPERDARETMLLLEAKAQGNRLDEEFRTMLSWYHSIFPFPFALFGADRYVPDVARRTHHDVWRSQFTLAQFENRGQLGHYWRSVLGAAAV